jgi:sigma-E factor negative regulatory protein RseB
MLSGRTGVVLGLALLATCGLVGPSDAASPGAVAGSDPAAQALLQRAVSAESATEYQGVEVMSVQDDGSGRAAAVATTEVVDVTHLPGRGTVLVEDADDGTPARAAFSAAQPDGDDSRPNVLLGLLSRTYRLTVGADDVVAGRPAHQVEAYRADGSLAARFWIDAATGLLLRRDLLGAGGRVLRSSEFLQLALSASVPRHLPVMLPELSGHPLSADALDVWRADGWPCPLTVGGLSLFDARTTAGGGATVLHLTYSDGLSAVSVFVEPGHLDGAAASAYGTVAATVGGQRVQVRAGAPREVVWSSSGYVITVVADAPPETVAAVVAGLPPAVGATGGWGRVQRGLSRVVSWLDPFS